MSFTAGLFSDVLANAPQAYGPRGLVGGSADWSKTLPMAGAVDWANVRPFQVINPLTGYQYGATQPVQTSSSSQPTQEKAPELTDYQKWLAEQSKPGYEMTSGHGEGKGYAGNLSDQDFADMKDMRDAYGGLSPADKSGLSGIAKAVVGAVTGNPIAGMAAAYQDAKKSEQALRDFQTFARSQGADNTKLGIQANLALTEMGLPSSNQGSPLSVTPKSEIDALINGLIEAGRAGIGSNADSDGSAGSVNPGGGGISGFGGGTY